MSAYTPAVGASEADRLEELGDEIATLAAHIHAATRRLLALIAEFDRRRGWEPSGQRDCAHWLAVRTGIDIHTAREQVRTARSLTGLPRLSEAMARGELSFSQVRAVTRIATSDNEADLLDLARNATAAQLERMTRSWKRGSRETEAAWERRRHESRTLSVFPGEDGMFVVRGRLDPEVGALLMRAIEAAGDALYRRNPTPGVDEDREAAQRRADAMALIAERALAAGFGAGAPTSGSKAERYRVVLHVEVPTLQANAEPGHSELEDGTRVSAETSRRVACDATVVPLARDAAGTVLDVGRKTRTVPPAIRRALDVRDRGCRFPGCGMRFTDAHHVRHWADGGETSLDNCLLLCRRHHRLVHEGGWTVAWRGAGRPVFTSPRGDEYFEGGWTAPPLAGTPAKTLVLENLMRGVRPDGWTAAAKWTSEKEIPDEVYFRATAAIQDASSVTAPA